MKLKNFSIPVLRDSFNIAVTRFPLAIISAFTCGLISIYMIEMDRKLPGLQRTFFSLAIGLPWLTGIHLLAESYLKSITQKSILFLFGVVFLVFIIIFIAPDFDEDRLERPIRFFSFFIIAHLLVALAPFLKAGNLKRFWEYNKDAFVIWYVGAFYALIIYLGLTMALLAIDKLFDMKVEWKLYAQIFAVIAAGFHPVYVLSNFPNADKPEAIRTSYTKAIRNLCFFILIPLTILYFLILYAYGIKIIDKWELPRGWVSSLVLGFSGIGVITYLLNYLLPDLEENKLSHLFKKYFFYILTPLVILLFVAINRRLTDYGFTPPRYFVLITGIWLFLSCLYFIFSKTDNIKLIPMSLIVFLIFGTMSPFDAFHTSVSSQFKRLAGLLEKNKMLENGKIKSSLAGLEIPDKESVKDLIYALDKMGELNYINSLLSESIPFDTIVYHDPRDFLFEKLGLSQPSEMTEKYETIYLSAADRNDYPIDGYDRIFMFNLYKGNSDDNISLIESGGSSKIVCKKIQDTIPLTDLLLTIDTRHQKSGNEGILDQSFDVNTKTYKYRLYLKNLNYLKGESKLTADYMQAVLLTGKK